MGLQFFRQFHKSNVVYYSNPTWPIQQTMAEFLGFDARPYPYYDPKNISIDFEGMMTTLDEAPESSMVMLHVSSHNPTGFDLSKSQWKDVRDMVIRKKHMPYFDMAYQGFASGDLVKDSYSLRLFADAESIPFMLGTSFAKNMGLYGTRTGTFSMNCDSAENAAAIKSQLNKIARNTWSSPPMHGSEIARIILNTKNIRKHWEHDLITMSSRIAEMREALCVKLEKLGSPHCWNHIRNQIGMFAFTGISKENCQKLIDEHNIYLTLNGRISVAGLNWNNLDYVAESFHSVTESHR